MLASVAAAGAAVGAFLCAATATAQANVADSHDEQSEELFVQPAAGAFDAEWRAIKAAEKEKKPQTVAALAENLARKAGEAGDDDTTLRALLHLAAAKSDLERRETRHFAAIRVLAPRMEQASPRLRAMLAVSLAHIWNGYYQENHWRLLNESTVSETEGSVGGAGGTAAAAADRIIVAPDVGGSAGASASVGVGGASASAGAAGAAADAARSGESAARFAHGRDARATLPATAAATPAAMSSAVPETQLLQTWSGARVREEIRRYYALALANPAVLRATPISVFGSALPRLNHESARPDALRPTLYDFLVHDAVAFLVSITSDTISQAENEFEPDPESPLLGTLDEFLNWKPVVPPASRTNVPLAIALYQELLRFRVADTASVAALADADLSRILWAGGVLGAAEGADLRVEQALRAHIERWKHHESSANAAAELAKHLRRQDRDGAPLEAYRAASLGISLHPRSAGADRCRSILAALEIADLDGVRIEGTWGKPAPEINVSHINLKRVHFRVIAVDWRIFLSPQSGRPDNLSDADRVALLRRRPAREWSAELPGTDYARATHSVPAPADLAPGFYFLATCADPSFDPLKATVALNPFHATDLALVTTFVPQAGAPTAEPVAAAPARGLDAKPRRAALVGDAGQLSEIQGCVLDSRLGQPVANAKVEAWYLRGASRQALAPVATDAEGVFKIRVPREYLYYDLLFLATDPATGQQVSNEFGERHLSRPVRGIMERAPDSKAASLHVHFLTDRALYRPGQEIRFKAVVFTSNRHTNEYAVAPNHNVTVALQNSGGKDIATLRLRTNANGSVSGHFTAPVGGLNGGYELRTTGAENGRGHIRVEEYKRPKFEADIAAPAAPPVLGRAVTVAGKALAYTGQPVAAATVRYTVRRTVRWPLWCWWGGAPSHEKERQLASGVTRTDAAGAFSVTFNALPDKGADPSGEPVFNYEISAEITDATGETRTARRTIAIGRASVAAEISAAAWQTPTAPVAVKITVRTLDGAPVPAVSGKLALYTLKQPAATTRLRLDEAYYGDELIRSEVRLAAARAEPSDPRNWDEDEGVATHTVTTDARGAATAAVPLPAGIYRAVFTAADRDGAPVSARAEITVRDPAAAHSGVRVPFSFAAEKTECRPGDTFTGIWSSGYDTARARVLIRHRGRIVHAFWTDPARTQQVVRFPVTEAHRGGFSYSVWQVRENRICSATGEVRVPWDNKELNLSWERFRNRLTPEGHETWTLKIKPAVPDATAAAVLPELAAALYDASLDQLGGANSWDALSPFYHDPAVWLPHAFSNAARRKSHNLAARRDEKGVLHYDDDHWWMQRRKQKTHDLQSLGRFSPEWMHWDNARPWYDENARRLYPRGKNMVSLFGAPAEFAAPMMMTRAAVRAENADAPPAAASSLDLITPRANLKETAFFFPALVADADGTVRLEFTVPAALTRWKFLAFAHDARMRSGAFVDDSITTTRPLMVQPNPPRFLREGDIVEITVKITNKTAQPQTGRARLTFADALTLDPADAALGNTTPERPFTLAAGAAQTLAWRVRVPDGLAPLVYKAVAAAGLESDGEQGHLPVLSRRQLVTESRHFAFKAAATPTLAPQTLTLPPPAGLTASLDTAAAADAAPAPRTLALQSVSAPAWDAILALPYLAEYPHECSEQLFARVYANALARHIVTRDPAISRVFRRWRDTPALQSPLFKNTDIKNILLEETPWVRDAESETAQRRDFAVLFDNARLDAELRASILKLGKQMRPDGFWPWFEDGPPSPCVTRHIVAGFGRLRHGDIALPAGKDADPLLARAIAALDAWMLRQYKDAQTATIRTGKPVFEITPLDPLIAYHLYARSFFTYAKPAATADGKGQTAGSGSGGSASRATSANSATARGVFPIPEEARPAYEFYHELALRDWARLPLQSRAHLALAFHRRAQSEPQLFHLPDAAAATPDATQSGTGVPPVNPQPQPTAKSSADFSRANSVHAVPTSAARNTGETPVPLSASTASVITDDTTAAVILPDDPDPPADTTAAIITTDTETDTDSPAPAAPRGTGGSPVSPTPAQPQSATAAPALIPNASRVAAATIIASLREHLKTDDPELGAYWPQLSGNASDSWFHAPIETHALLMEAIHEIAPDPALHADLQLWLLRQKQTTAWPTTKSTTDAIHALLLPQGRTDIPVCPPAATASKSGTGVPPVNAAAVSSASSESALRGTGGSPVSPQPQPTAKSSAAFSRANAVHASSARAAAAAPHPLLPAAPPALVFNLAGRPHTPRTIEAGTGYYSERLPAAALAPAAFRDITVTRPAGATGPAWGSVTWQYFQTLDKIAPAAATPLKIRKIYYKKTTTPAGVVLVPLVPAAPAALGASKTAFQTATVTGGAIHAAVPKPGAAIVPGDTLVVRLEITADREMEFVHIKDQRPSGTEPDNVPSGYRWRGGLGFYETTRDAATHFFIDRLPAGVRVIEYSIRAQHRGFYQTGLAEAQSMYAPAFISRAPSHPLRVE